MKINPVSFGRIFDIYYNQGQNTTQTKLADRMYIDRNKLLADCCNRTIEMIECGNNLISDTNSHLAPNVIRIFTGNSYKEYKMLKNIGSDIAEDYASKEAKRLYIQV